MVVFGSYVPRIDFKRTENRDAWTGIKELRLKEFFVIYTDNKILISNLKKI